MPNSEQVRILLQRYRQGQCTPEEIMVIENWYQQLLDKSAWDFQPGEEALTGDRIKARMSGRLQLSSTTQPLKAVPIYRHKWFRIAAAASILLMVAAGTWRWLDHTAPTPEKITPLAVQDAVPGGNKAVLTLSNGDHIILDSATNGSLPPQGNAQVQKSGTGQLVYHASATAAASIVYNTLTTPRGGQYQLRLPDGTQIWLNAASSITYPTTFAGKDRSVSITGEVYFEVAPNARLPFRVKTGPTAIEVLGTHFNINAYADEITVNTTLLEGSVKVIRGQQSQVLAPGEQASVNAAGAITRNTKVDLDQVMAWKNGKFIFGDKADIYTVMRQVARWYDIDVEYRGTVTQHFWGSMSRETNASQVFKLLEATGGVHFIIEGKKVIVLPSTK